MEMNVQVTQKLEISSSRNYKRFKQDTVL